MQYNKHDHSHNAQFSSLNATISRQITTTSNVNRKLQDNLNEKNPTGSSNESTVSPKKNVQLPTEDSVSNQEAAKLPPK